MRVSGLIFINAFTFINGFTAPSFLPFLTGFAFVMILFSVALNFWNLVLADALLLVQSVRQTQAGAMGMLSTLKSVASVGRALTRLGRRC
jgi:hypothetical protein